MPLIENPSFLKRGRGDLIFVKRESVKREKNREGVKREAVKP